MIVTGNYDQSVPGKQFFIDNRPLSTKSQIVYSGAAVSDQPNAFLVRQEPNTTLPVHFHSHSQFQVVVKGSGTLGRHELRPLSLHYAGQQTAYGPIKPGEDGLWYMTLRPLTDTGAFFMPESRDVRDRQIPRREAFTEPLDLSDAETLKSLAQASTEVLLAPDDRGLAAWLMRIPAGAEALGPTESEGLGRFYIVVAGAASIDGKELRWLGTAWASGEDQATSVRAGSGGAEVLVIQYPTDACDYAPAALDAAALAKLDGDTVNLRA